MAKITPGPMAGQISGRLASAVFSHNRGGPYVRNGTIPTTVTSNYALAAKARMTAASQAWKLLSDAQRTAWTNYAEQSPVLDRLGKSISLSGAAMFNRFVCRMASCGDAPLAAPPVGDPPIPLTSLALTAVSTAQALTLSFAATPLGAADKLMIWACLCESDGIAYINNLLRLVEVSAVAAESPYNFSDSFLARFGAIQAGQTAHVRVQVYSSTTGYVSQVLQAKFLVIPA